MCDGRLILTTDFPDYFSQRKDSSINAQNCKCGSLTVETPEDRAAEELQVGTQRREIDSYDERRARSIGYCSTSCF